MADERDTGIPTRAIHESYLNLQQAHREYRQARDDPTQTTQRAHAGFQDAVMTFYELVRPHLKRKSGVAKFWHGRLPEYPERAFSSEAAARDYYAQGVAVWGFQTHVETRPARSGSGAATAATDGGAASFETLHEQLGLTDTTRVIAVDREESVLVWKELRAVAGLRQLDSWGTREVTTREQGAGFMASETNERTELRHVDVARLTKAKRLLAEAADKMSLLSRIDVDHEDGVITNFDQSGDEPQAGYTTGEYDSSPDI